MNDKTYPTMTLTTPSDTEVTMTRVFDAPRELVWEAWTNPKHVPNWLTGPEGWTMTRCEIDLRVGSEWRFAWRKDDGEEMAIHGVFKEIAAPERLVSTEVWGGDFPETLQTLTFTQENGKTKFTNTLLYPSQEARDAALKTGMADGTEMSFNSLDDYLSTLD